MSQRDLFPGLYWRIRWTGRRVLALLHRPLSHDQLRGTFERSSHLLRPQLTKRIEHARQMEGDEKRDMTQFATLRDRLRPQRTTTLWLGGSVRSDSLPPVR